jgi:ribose/xylose/arabinose/galactoside ABC-type transport system permease subunit
VTADDALRVDVIDVERVQTGAAGAAGGGGGAPGPARSDLAAVRRMSALLNRPQAGLVIALGILVLYLAATQERFIAADNLSNMMRTNVVLFIVAIGATPVLIVGVIDLSPGAVLALTTISYGTVVGTVPDPLAVPLAIIAASLAVMLINGLPVARFGMEPFVVTLATSVLLRGIANLTTKGQTKILNDIPVATALADRSVGPVPIAFFVAGALTLLFGWILRSTYLGRDIYAVGGNREAAAMSGIPVRRVMIIAYGMLGACAGLAAVVQAGRLASAAPSAGIGLELLALAAVLLGGTRLGGGQGTIFGTVVGVAFLAVVDNGLTISGVSQFWKDVVTGAVLFAAVVLARLQRHLQGAGGSPS